MQRNKLVIILLSAVIMLALIIVATNSLWVPNAQPPIPKDLKTLGGEGRLKSYINDSYHFKILIPKDWEVEEVLDRTNKDDARIHFFSSATKEKIKNNDCSQVGLVDGSCVPDGYSPDMFIVVSSSSLKDDGSASKVNEVTFGKNKYSSIILLGMAEQQYYELQKNNTYYQIGINEVNDQIKSQILSSFENLSYNKESI